MSTLPPEISEKVPNPLLRKSPLPVGRHPLKGIPPFVKGGGEGGFSSFCACLPVDRYDEPIMKDCAEKLYEEGLERKKVFLVFRSMNPLYGFREKLFLSY